MARFGGYGRGGGGGGMNMQQMMREAQKLQEQMAQAREELEDARVTGTSGGGAVTVTLSGSKRFISISIKPEVIDPDDAEMLEDLITAAANEAYAAADELVKNSPLSQLGGI